MTQDATSDSFGKAAVYLLLGITAGLSLDIVAKWLLQDYPLQQFVFLRSLFGLLFFFFIARWYGGFASLLTSRWRWHLLRTILASCAMFGFFYGLKYMPLVNALTLAFTAPLIVTALSVPFLGEHVGRRRWIAVIVGFIGVLIILRPGAGLIDLASLAVLAAAAAYAGLALTARKLAATESSFALSVYVISGPLVISSFTVADNWIVPDRNDWILFLLAGVFSALAWIGIVGGYRRASPVILAPFEYLALIGGAIAGYIIWDEIPDGWVVVGALVIIGSGLYIVYREVGSAISNRYLRVFTTIGAAAMVQRRKRRKQ
jgi:drug/metabolite transporter (DMT)-like permease